MSLLLLIALVIVCNWEEQGGGMTLGIKVGLGLGLTYKVLPTTVTSK